MTPQQQLFQAALDNYLNARSVTNGKRAPHTRAVAYAAELHAHSIFVAVARQVYPEVADAVIAALIPDAD